MSQEISKNRKAFHDFNIVDKFEAGIELRGTEVKSIREGMRLQLCRMDRSFFWAVTSSHIHLRVMNSMNREGPVACYYIDGK
jgi:tmRNA-binding protein